MRRHEKKRGGTERTSQRELFWRRCSEGLTHAMHGFLIYCRMTSTRRHRKIKRATCIIFLQIYKYYMTKRLQVKADHSSKILGRVIWVRKTLWQWGIVAPQVLPALTLVIIASSVISGLEGIFVICWLERLLLNDRGLGYLWTKEANIPLPVFGSTGVELDHWWPHLFMTMWLLALTREDILHCQGQLTENYVFMNYIWRVAIQCMS